MIDVMKLGCVFCGALPIEELDDNKMVFCKNCNHSITKYVWQQAAVEAMANTLARTQPAFRVYFHVGPKKKKAQFYWSSHFELKGPFASREDAIHDAWLKLYKRRIS